MSKQKRVTGPSSVERRINVEKFVGLHELSAASSSIAVARLAHLVTDHLRRRQRSDLAGRGIDVTGIEKLWIMEAIWSPSFYVRFYVVEVSKVAGEVDVALVVEASVSTDYYSILRLMSVKDHYELSTSAHLIRHLSYLRILVRRDGLAPVDTLQLACERRMQRYYLIAKPRGVIGRRCYTLNGQGRPHRRWLDGDKLAIVRRGLHFRL